MVEREFGDVNRGPRADPDDQGPPWTCPRFSQKHAQRDLLRSIAAAVLQLLMEADADGPVGAGVMRAPATARPGARAIAIAPSLPALDALNLRVPKLRRGSSFPGFPEGPQDLGTGAGRGHSGSPEQRRVAPPRR